MTPQGRAKLIQHEGEVLHAYQDGEGYWTIGIGHLIDARKGGSIPKAVSDWLFDDDLTKAIAGCRGAWPWFDHLDPVRQDVIINLVFNMGICGVNTFKRMIAAIVDQNWTQAAWELSNSKWKSQVGRERHDELTNALEHGSWDRATV